MTLYQVTGEERWLQAPFQPRRDVRLIADEGAGLPPEVQAEIREAAVAVLAAAPEPAIPAPDEALLLRMMRTCLAEEVPAEYAPMMLEQMGFRPLLAELPPLQAEPDVVDDTWPVLIVGAGVSGICLAKLLLDVGIPFLVIDKNGDVGGTWWENRYPGCGVDTPNHAYSYSFGPRYPWTSYFSPRGDIQDYLEGIADWAGVRPHMRFETEVLRADWQAETACWAVRVRCGGEEQLLRTRALVSAVGQLNLPSVPDIPGAGDFAGPLFHSARWPDGLDLAGKRVAVVGTGASAMQIVPTIADSVAELTVFQRHPQWARPIPRYHDQLTPGAQWLIDHAPFYAEWLRFAMFWRYGDGLLPFLKKDPDWPHPERSMNRVNEKHRLEMLAHMESVLADRPDLLAGCVPDYPPYGKRILLDNGWFETLLKPNVALVTDAIESFDGQGVNTADGRHHPADVVVMATGFDVGAMAARLNISGRDGLALDDYWEHGNPRGYLGVSVAGFPNLFNMLGPNTGLGHGGSAMFVAECHARYIVDCLLHMHNIGRRVLEVDPAVQADYVARVDAEHAGLIWMHPGLHTYYRNAQGRVFSLLPWRLVDHWQMTRRFDPADFLPEPAAAPTAAAS
jgi:4-hydroxyacetophenone monooxygenase